MKKLTARALPYQLPGYPDYLAALLHARGISGEAQAARFLNPSLDQLHDPLLLHDMGKACDLIIQAAEKKLKVAVYGDYDADGVCASAIVLEALSMIGISAFSYIPDRQTEGYGLNSEAIRILAAQADLLISVDCGVTALKEAALARELGLRLIITDHHALPDELPLADAIVHPGLAGYPDSFLCGAGIAWKIACALLGVERAEGLLDLAALATVADLVPLSGENRVITALGLKKMAGSHRLGLKALKRTAGIREGKPVSAEQVGYQLAPRLNAGGRLASAQSALNLLMTEDTEEAEILAKELDRLNRERRDVESQVIREAAHQLFGQDMSRTRSIVLSSPGWNTGVVGLAAGKLAERWNYPTIVLSENGDELSGSGRSAGGIDLHQALSECRDLFHRFGGHRMAAGLSLPAENLQAFRERFDAAVRRQLGVEDLLPEIVYDCPLALSEVSLKTIQNLEQLAPFGMGNPAPLFLLDRLSLVSSRAVGSESAHLKLTVASGGTVREGIAFHQGGLQGGLADGFQLIASVDANEYNGRVSAQLKVKALLPGEDAFAPAPGQEARALLRGLLASGDEKEPVNRVMKPPEPKGSRGMLYAASCAQTANALHKAWPMLQTSLGLAADPRGFSAIVLAPDWTRPFARYDTVIFADGLFTKGEAALARKATGACRCDVLPESEALRSLFATLRLSLEDLRLAYVSLLQRAASVPNLHPNAFLAARLVLEELGLITLNGQDELQSIISVQKIDPDKSRLFRLLSKP
jgi:single-stranded-DNA-specific exonuclease